MRCAVGFLLHVADFVEDLSVTFEGYLQIVEFPRISEALLGSQFKRDESSSP
jgi:hypothetical protein